MNPIIVANVDGACSLRESAAIAESMRELLNDPAYRPLLLVAGHECFSDAALRVMLETHTKDIDSYLAQVAGLLERVPDIVADAYRCFARYAILHVAEASRDGIFGLVGAKISESEKAIIRTMVDALGIVLSESDQAKLDIPPSPQLTLNPNTVPPSKS